MKDVKEEDRGRDDDRERDHEGGENGDRERENGDRERDDERRPIEDELDTADIE